MVASTLRPENEVSKNSRKGPILLSAGGKQKKAHKNKEDKKVTKGQLGNGIRKIRSEHPKGSIKLPGDKLPVKPVEPTSEKSATEGKDDKTSKKAKQGKKSKARDVEREDVKSNKKASKGIKTKQFNEESLDEQSKDSNSLFGSSREKDEMKITAHVAQCDSKAKEINLLMEATKETQREQPNGTKKRKRKKEKIINKMDFDHKASKEDHLTRPVEKDCKKEKAMDKLRNNQNKIKNIQVSKPMHDIQGARDKKLKSANKTSAEGFLARFEEDSKNIANQVGENHRKTKKVKQAIQVVQGAQNKLSKGSGKERPSGFEENEKKEKNHNFDGNQLEEQPRKKLKISNNLVDAVENRLDQKKLQAEVDHRQKTDNKKKKKRQLSDEISSSEKKKQKSSNVSSGFTPIHLDEPEASSLNAKTGYKIIGSKKPRRLGRIKPESISAANQKLIQSSWLEASQLRELGVMYTKGKFSKKEDEALIKALETYKEMNQLNEEDIHRLIFEKNGKKGAKKNFWKDIASVLENRPLKTITNHVQRMKHPFKGAGKWTSEDDARLIRLKTEYGTNWKKIGELMERTGTSCRDRHRDYLELRETKKSGKWSRVETRQLYEIIDELVNEGQSPHAGIPWGLVSKKMGLTRSQLQCRSKWQRDVRIRYIREDLKNAPVWTEEDTLKMLEKLWGVQVEEDVDIPWEALADDPNWGPWTPEYLRRMWGAMKRWEVEYTTMPFDELVEKLYYQYCEKRKIGGLRPNISRKAAPLSSKFVEDSDVED
ncbi:hypothetical protein G9A89_015402 [Geosiphon pyriformis]|nr:hypothetical protein G9A89_015402 [Geosiphon pyriformis]